MLLNVKLTEDMLKTAIKDYFTPSIISDVDNINIEDMKLTININEEEMYIISVEFEKD